MIAPLSIFPVRTVFRCMPQDLRDEHCRKQGVAKKNSLAWRNYSLKTECELHVCVPIAKWKNAKLSCLGLHTVQHSNATRRMRSHHTEKNFVHSSPAGANCRARLTPADHRPVYSDCRPAGEPIRPPLPPQSS
jgi:hypothetical protein